MAKVHKPTIVVLDGTAINTGDFSWEEFHTIGDCMIYDRTPKNLIVERCKNATIAITKKAPFDEAILSQLPQLKYIGVAATGYNHVDCEAAEKRGILVTHIPSYSTPIVAQHVFALLLEITNQVGMHNEAVQGGEWETSIDYSFWKSSLIELDQLTLGIIGYGKIGQAVAQIALGFGMKVIVHTRSAKIDQEKVDLPTLFKTSDIVSLHCPLLPTTRHLINEETLGLMKPNAILINTARGELIDEHALAKALKEKKIFAAGLDVLEQEPPRPECPLLRLQNCWITPHMAWTGFKARERLFLTLIANIKAYLAGIPQNSVNG